MPVSVINLDPAAEASPAVVTETTEFLYVYPKGFFPDRRNEPDVGDVVVDTEMDPFEVLSVAAHDGDELIILKVSRSAGFITNVEFVIGVSGADA
jgi:hypothetical protein